MHLTILLPILAAVSTSFAAPMNDVSSSKSITPRSRVLREGLVVGQRPHALGCRNDLDSHLLRDPVHCWWHDVQQHKGMVQGDLYQDFLEWKSEVRQDFTVLVAEFRKDIKGFDEEYDTFKSKVEAVAGTTSAASLPAYDIRYDIALIWQELGQLAEDRRPDIYRRLVALAKAITKGTPVFYYEYPQSCTGILLQIETLQNYFRRQINPRSYQKELLDVHRLVFQAAHPAWARDYISG